MHEAYIEDSHEAEWIEVAGLDIGRVVAAGLARLGRIPEDPARVHVEIHDGNPALPEFCTKAVRLPKLVVGVWKRRDGGA